MKKTNILDEMQIIRFGCGVKLIEPNDQLVTASTATVGMAKQLPFSFYLLNTDGSTHIINEEGAAICGFESIDHSIGRTLLDVSKKESATHLINNCFAVINNKTTGIFEEEHLRKDNVTLQFLSVKAPWYDRENKIIGILGCSIVIGKHALANSLFEISKLGLLDTTPHALAKPAAFSSQKLKLDNITLSTREQECLVLTVRGYTAKRIARQLGISHRTVEEYINNIRLKAGVSSKAELVEKVLDHLC